MGNTVDAQSQPHGFGSRYAVLNLDLMSALVDVVKDTPEGKSFISSCVRWNNQVHQKSPRPLTVFTTVYFAEGQPELTEGAPFTRLVNEFGGFKQDTPEVQIAPYFQVDDKDILLRKTRWFAGAGNGLETLLQDHNIDTVILSGMTLSGVIMATAYRLFDLDYNIYVISDNVLELPLEHNADFSRVMLESLLAKMKCRRISLQEALELLGQS